LEVVDLAAGRVEIVITGRRADPRLIERADLVTEMREVKHYYAKGVPARRGIES
ncbi:MAG: cob(I)yrinic acid a,c-diamide adenosyltransferase, partial [Spirochaetes bacterium]|nr:cob(I)yrinic acid a,c-diamide adenosyltransferase [Spirochaetota bacterium]